MRWRPAAGRSPPSPRRDASETGAPDSQARDNAAAASSAAADGPASVGTSNGAGSPTGHAPLAVSAVRPRGPRSTRTRTPSSASVPTAAAKRSGHRSWSRQYRPSRSSGPAITFPVRQLTNSAEPGRVSIASPAASTPSRIGSTSALCPATRTESRAVRTPSPARRDSTAATISRGPVSSWWAPLSAAVVTPVPTSLASSSGMRRDASSPVRNTTPMPPPEGTDATRRPWRIANRIPFSRLTIPAACAAAHSPTLKPSTAAGRSPTRSQNAVSPHANAYSAGCAHSAASRSASVPSSPNITGNRRSPTSSANIASHRSSTSRTPASLR